MSWGSTLIHQEALVLCVDEKSRIQALDRTQPGLPIKKERFGSMTHDYKRNGTTTLFAALETLQGKVVGECHQRHPDQEFSEIPATTRQRVSGRYLAASDHGQLRHPQACESDRVAQASPTVCASFCSHQFQLDESRRALVRSPRHKAIKRGVFLSVADLQASIAAFLSAWNESPRPFVWTAAIESVQEKLSRCRRTLEQTQPGCTAPKRRNRKKVAVWLFLRHYTTLHGLIIVTILPRNAVTSSIIALSL
jgi:hypothetical protein